MLCSILLISLVSSQSFAQKSEPNIAQNSSATRSVNSDEPRETCPALEPVNVDLSCFHGESRQRISCNESMISDTVVVPKCKPFHVPEKMIDYREMKCQKNGQWDQELFKCITDCGHINELEPLIFNGTMTTVDQSPWNAAVYRISQNYLLICGSTIISPRIVVSAAHCFFDMRYDKPLNATDYEIVVGKYTRDYKTDDGTQKKHKISRLKVHENFNPERLGHFAFDIAVLILEEPIELSKYALPACIDWTTPGGFAPGKSAFGTLSGWGITNETDIGRTLSPVLLTAKLPFISYSECLLKFKPLGNDQFCAGSDSGPGARRGDAGAGLLFYDDKKEKYFLRGIVSTGKKNDIWDKPSSVAAYTDISFHLTWLNKERITVDSEQAR